ncbi:Venom carboxylesterase-6 [Armadillidium nasatum]|uniref:Carboxylic ester hydrolase n=1 Tax=Armadillidium nasatum TaxID=96803 RepID=A0A5N5TGM5_9CRUS|nr:Venom carboxylesterase-6 [Armadillidium nasatum]
MSLKTFCFQICIFLCISKFSFCTGDNEAPIIKVKQGQIQGFRDESLNGTEFFSYLSIPYAKPPEGDLRFKDPVPLESWDGVLNGTKMPVSCLQTSFYPLNYDDGITSCVSGREDCLYLNVFTSAPNEPDRKLPVMVYIHGGGFVGGKADFQPYVLMNHQMVLVVIQYRLGIFGFLSMEDSVMPGNMGLKDQQLALKWVKENIEVFGGDSNMITIFGQSAGSASVHYQILSEGSKGLFNRAILQSGMSLCPWASNHNHRVFAIEAGREFNCSIDFGTKDYLECMQNVHPYFLTLAGAESNKFGPISLFFENEENSLNLTKQVYQYYLKRDNFTVTDEDWKEIVELIPMLNYTLITHADDLVYLSYDKKSSRLKLENEDDLKVRDIFVNLWTNFAKIGPNSFWI